MGFCCTAGRKRSVQRILFFSQESIQLEENEMFVSLELVDTKWHMFEIKLNDITACQSKTFLCVTDFMGKNL